MMPVGKLCGIAVIIVVITPVLIGMCWPDGTQEVDTWDVERGIEITGDLSNRIIPIYDNYTGPLNNLSVYDPIQSRFSFPTPRETTENPSSYPVSTVESSENITTITIEDMALSGKARYLLIADSDGLTVTGDSGTYSIADYWPATNVLILYDSDGPVKTLTPKLDDVITGRIWLSTFSAPTEYMKVSEGLISPATPWAWLNGMKNEAVEIWVKPLHTNAAYFQCDTVRITYEDGTLKASDGNEQQALGSVYDYVSIKITADKMTVTGLIGVESFADRTYTEGNTLEFEPTGNLDIIPMAGAYADWWVVATTSAIGSTTGINNSSFSPEAYYGVHSWQVQIINPSVFGDSLTFEIGDATQIYAVAEDRTISVVNLDSGDTVAEPVRDMRILSLVFDGVQTVYINGVPAIRGEPADAMITLGDKWLASVVISKVTQSSHEEYTWDIGSFGLDQTSFCIAGLLSCVSIMIIGSLWGRRSGESVLALFITMIICGIAYYCLI